MCDEVNNIHGNLSLCIRSFFIWSFQRICFSRFCVGRLDFVYSRTKKSLTSMCTSFFFFFRTEQNRKEWSTVCEERERNESIVCVYACWARDRARKTIKMYASLVCFHLYFLSHYVCIFCPRCPWIPYLRRRRRRCCCYFFSLSSVQLFYYVYSFYINLSFNDVNDFIFRFSLVLCWILISWYFLHALFFLSSVHSSCFPSILLWRFFYFFFFLFAIFLSSSFSSLHNTWYFCKYSIYRNWLVDEMKKRDEQKDREEKNCYPIT